MQPTDNEANESVGNMRPQLQAARQPPVRTIACQLLVVVNLTMALLVALLLLLDYCRELNVRVHQKRIALEEEAKTLLPAVTGLARNGREAIQEHLDAVCRTMHDGDSPGHHIAARMDGEVFQATAHGRASPVMLRAMENGAETPSGLADLGRRQLVVGSTASGDATVYVAEDIRRLRSSVLGQVAWRLGGILLLGIAAAMIASAALMRLIAQPVRRVVSAVDRIANSDFSVRVAGSQTHELHELSLAINSMAARLEQSERERDHDLAEARKIQQNLLPRDIGAADFRTASIYDPASAVAGDYYDVIPLEDGSWLFCIADVCGHSIPAAMSAAMLKLLVFHAIEHHTEPDKLLRFVNQRFTQSCPDLFASMLLVHWVPAAERMAYASAGHEPGFLLTADGNLRELEPTGTVLGVIPNAEFHTQHVIVNEGDRLFLGTDGLPETFSPDGEMFGRDRLRSVLRKWQYESVETILQKVNEALIAHRQASAPSDDVTILAAEFAAAIQRTDRPHRWQETTCQS